MTKTTVELGQYPLQVRPEPLHLRPWTKRESIVPAPPPSREPSFRSSDQWSQKALAAESELPPVDRGIGAWKFLFGAFMIEAFMFGYPLNYGVFQNYYSTHAPFEGNTNLSNIGTLGTCFYYLGAPIATYLVRRYSRCQKAMIWAGFAVCIVGLGAAGWAKDFGSLVATQGVTFGMGLLIMYYPIFNMMNEWFVERRGLALAVICASTGVTGLFYPFLLEILLNKYGPATTLRLSAVGLMVLCGPCVFLFKNREPVTRDHKVPATDYSFLKMPLFYLFCLAGLLQGLGFFFPTIYLPSYAVSLGFSGTMGAMLLMVYSLAQVLGQMAFGYISDMRVKRFWLDERVPVQLLLFVSTFVSGIAIFALWGPARSLGMLIAFAIFYGVSSGAFAVLWARMSSTLSPSPAMALTTFSYFALMKGIGNVVTGPISSALISLSPAIHRDAYANGKFKGLVVFSGACMMASAAVMVVWYVGKVVAGRLRRKGQFCECPA